MGTRDELVEAAGARYRGAPRERKGRILEFVAMSGYCRKNAARILRRKSRPFSLSRLRTGSRSRANADQAGTRHQQRTDAVAGVNRHAIGGLAQFR